MQKYSPISDDEPNMREDSEGGTYYWSEDVEALLQSNAATAHAMVSTLNARIADLVAGLQRFGIHTIECEAMSEEPGECDCGLRSLMETSSHG